MLNQVTLIGNLGNDSEVSSNGQLLRISVATTNKYKNKQGEWVKHTEWHSVKLWHDKAEEMAKRFKKGTKVLVSGSISTFKTNEGINHTFIKAKSVKSLSPLPQKENEW